MRLFQNILVGVDLSQCRPLRVSSLSSIARETIGRGIELARLNSAKLVILSALNLSDENLLALPEAERAHLTRSVRPAAEQVIEEIAADARQQGVEDAVGKLVPGKGWIAIVQQVLREKHDLVVVGTRDITTLRHALFGNTAMKLLRRCPCPVLVTKAGTDMKRLNILVATDYKPAGEQAMRLAISVARQLKARLHILHVVDYPLDRIWSTGLADTRESEYHRRVRTESKRILKKQLEGTAYKSLGKRVHVHFVEGIGLPDEAIQHFIQVHRIHLLVMGTIGRGGIPGIMIGNTAERLLPEVRCSVLAVKPPDFQCPVQLEE